MSLTRAFFLVVIIAVFCSPFCTLPSQGQIWTVYNRVDPYHRPVAHSTCFQPLGMSCYWRQPSELPNTQIEPADLGIAPDAGNSEPNTITVPAESVVEPQNNDDEVIDASLIDNQDSASDLSSRATKQIDRDSDLQSENESLQAKISELQDRLMEARQKQADELESTTDAIRQARVRSQQRIAEAISQAKKESAWEIAKLRKDSEKLNQQLTTEKEKAAADREKLLKRLKNVEAKLKNAKQKNNKDLPEPPRQNTVDDTEMKKQIDRAIEKIRRRFEEKIKRARKGENADQAIEKLRQEMDVQIEKIEERIRNRFKNRR